MRIQDIGTFNAVARSRAGQAAALRGRASAWAWAPAARATAPRASTTPSPKPSSAAGCDVQAGARSAASASAPQEPLVNVWLPGRPLVILRRVQPNDVPRILDDIAAGHRPRGPGAVQDRGVGPPHRATSSTAPAFRRSPPGTRSRSSSAQKKIVLRNCGLISPDDIEEYIAIGGYQALYKVLIDDNAGAGDRADQGRPSCAAAAAPASSPASSGSSCARPRRTRSTSSATRTKAIPAPT